MATATELENIIIRMSADVDNLLQGMDQVRASSDSAAQSAVQNATRMEDSLRNVAAAAASAFAALGTERFLRSSLHDFEEAESAAIKMESALRANGREVEVLAADYQDFAAEMQKFTTVSDEAAASLLTAAEGFQLTGAAAKAASNDAVALAHGNAGLAQSYLRVTAAVASGDVERARMFARMIPQLRGIKDEAEFMERYSKSVAAGGEATRRLAQTVGGQLEQLKNDWSDFKEEVGRQVAEWVRPVIRFIRDVVHWLQRMPPEIRSTIIAAAGLTAGFVALSTTGPKVISILISITESIKSMTAAMVSNPMFLAATVGLVAIYLLGRALTGLSGASDEYNKRLKENKNLADSFVTNVDHTSQSIEDAQRRLSEYTGKLKEEQDRIAAKPFLLRTVGESFGKTTEEMETQISTLKRNIASAEAAVGSPAEQLRKKMEAIKKEVEETTKEQFKLLDKVGMTTAEATRYELKIKGANEAQLDAVRIMQRQVEVAEKLNKLKEMEKHLTEQMEEAGLDAAAKAALDAKRLGGSQEDVARIKRIVEETEKLNKAAELAKKFQTPQAMVAKEVAELDDMLKSGKITWEVYALAVEEARKKLVGVAAAMRDAAGYGTAEARARIASFLDNRLFGPGRPPGNQVGHHFAKGVESSRQMQLQGIEPYNPEAKSLHWLERIALAAERAADQAKVGIDPVDLEE